MCLKWVGNEGGAANNHDSRKRPTGIYRYIAGRLNYCIEKFLSCGCGANRWYTL